MTTQGFTVKLCMFHRARDHQRHTIGVSFHHDADRLGLTHAWDGLD
jgi:hypothetical protein